MFIKDHLVLLCSKTVGKENRMFKKDLLVFRRVGCS